MSSALTKRKRAQSTKPNTRESRIRPDAAPNGASEEVEEIEEIGAAALHPGSPDAMATEATPEAPVTNEQAIPRAASEPLQDESCAVDAPVACAVALPEEPAVVYPPAAALEALASSTRPLASCTHIGYDTILLWEQGVQFEIEQEEEYWRQHMAMEDGLTSDNGQVAMEVQLCVEIANIPNGSFPEVDHWLKSQEVFQYHASQVLYVEGLHSALFQVSFSDVEEIVATLAHHDISALSLVHVGVWLALGLPKFHLGIRTPADAAVIIDLPTLAQACLQRGIQIDPASTSIHMVRPHMDLITSTNEGLIERIHLLRSITINLVDVVFFHW